MPSPQNNHEAYDYAERLRYALWQKRGVLREHSEHAPAEICRCRSSRATGEARHFPLHARQASLSAGVDVTAAGPLFATLNRSSASTAR